MKPTDSSSAKEWNVVFLLDAVPPTKIVLLKRGAHKTYLPNFYTGIGGKLDEGETAIESAYREMEEETGLTGINLNQFAKITLENGLAVHYFWGIFTQPNLSKTEDGELEWESVGRLLEKDLVPTTWAVCKEWAARNFSATQFTITAKETGVDRGARLIEVLKIEEGIS